MASRIRHVSLSDAPAIQRIYAPYITDSVISFEMTPPDTAEMAQRIGSTIRQFPWLVFERDGDVLGYAYAGTHNPRVAYQWSANVSVYLDARIHRQGVGRALYTTLFDLLRRQRYVNAYAGITLPNEGSVGLHQAMGFVTVAVYPKVGFKFGKWWDTTWLHLRLAEGDAPPVGDPLPPITDDHQSA
jgi:L-amino acid N-acyltransferase YncA